MYLEFSDNNGKKYIRICESVRVTDEVTHKSKANISPNKKGNLASRPNRTLNKAASYYLNLYFSAFTQKIAVYPKFSPELSYTIERSRV